MTPELERLGRIFFPYEFTRRDEVMRLQHRFVHYTSAQTALEIIRHQQIWMRKTTTMNDFREVEHGLDCLSAAYHSDVGLRFRRVIDEIFPDMSTRLGDLFDRWVPAIRDDTYLTCISEHLPPENEIGRLSMWRAYGATAGVALVLRPKVFFSESNALKAYSAPVHYLTKTDYQEQFAEVADAIDGNKEVLRAAGEETISGYLFHLYRSAVICTKHPGFKEEREWRVIYSPSFSHSDRLLHTVECVRNIPQPVVKIPLQNVESEGLIGLDLPSLIDRVIIGPTQYPSALCHAFRNLLMQAGIEEADKKVIVSDIPLRT